VAHSGGTGLRFISRDQFAPRLLLIKTDTCTMPIQCRQCEDAPCAKVCENHAIIIVDNAVKVLEERCIGCKNCLLACPFGVMELVRAEMFNKNEKPGDGGVWRQQRAQKCDLCQMTVQGPACVRVCPTKALTLVDENARLGV
jgi:electron transport protein HydN